MDEIKTNDSEINSKNHYSLKRIGNFIKEARISRNQSIEELASELKIGVHQLMAIEEGNEDILPERVFIKAMVRRISEKLKLDTDFIMNEFKIKRKEVKIEEIVQEVSNKNKNKNKTKLKGFNINSLSVGIFVFISGILGLLASSFIFSFFSDFPQTKDSGNEVIQKN